jgi:hypothetical protein
MMYFLATDESFAFAIHVSRRAGLSEVAQLTVALGMRCTAAGDIVLPSSQVEGETK